MRTAILLTCWVLVGPLGVMAQASRIEEREVASKALRNLRGEPTRRSLLVYLPQSYDTAPLRRYPVLYLLHAFGARNTDWLGTESGYEGLDVAATLDELAATGEATEMIVVMPDAHTSLGGSWYSDSPTLGDWEEFIAVDLVGEVDRTYRTIASRDGRALAGQSMGACGALRISIGRPEVFCAVVAMSPVPVEEANPLGEAGMRMALEVDEAKLVEAPLPARVLWSRAAAFSPDIDTPPAYARLPYRMEAGELMVLPGLWDLWERATLSRLVEDHASALRTLELRIEVGDQGSPGW